MTVLTGMPGATNPSSTFALSQKEKKRKERRVIPLGQRTRAELIQTSRPAYLLINEHKRTGVAVRTVAALLSGYRLPNGMMMRDLLGNSIKTSRSGSTGVDEGWQRGRACRREGKRNPVVKGCAGRSTRGNAYDSPRLSSGVFASATGRGILEAQRPGKLVLPKKSNMSWGRRFG